MPTITSNMSHDRRFLAISISFISNSPHGFIGVASLFCNSLAIPSSKLSVPVHLFLVANRPQHPLWMHLPIPEIWGLPWPINFLLLFHVQPPSSAFSSLKIPALQLGNISIKLFVVSPAEFFLIGVINFFPFGDAVVLGSPINFLIRLNGTHYLLSTNKCRSASIAVCLPCASLMHRVAP